MSRIFRPIFRKRPACKAKSGFVTTKSLLQEIGISEVAAAYELHQISASAVVLLALEDTLPREALYAAEEFLETLSKRTGWKRPETFIEMASRRLECLGDTRDHPETFSHGFAWRLLVISRFSDVWRNPPTLASLKKDVKILQQAALYHPHAVVPVLDRVAEKYHPGLWIVGVHYESWCNLFPRWGEWDGVLRKLSDCIESDRLPNKQELREIDMTCEHILHELMVHEQRLAEDGKVGGLRGRKGDSLLAKVVDECHHQWRWVIRTDPLSDFRSFYGFVMGCIDAMKISGFKETSGTQKNVRRYLRLFVQYHNGFGSFLWNELETIPGARRSEYVVGHSASIFPRNRKYWWPRMKIYFKAFGNTLRGYPWSMDNHNRIW